MLELPLLPGPNVSLREAEPRDVDSLYAVFTDPDVMRYWSSPPWTDRGKVEALLVSDTKARVDGNALRWLITADDEAVGCVSLHRIDAKNRRAELGYVLGRPAWGRGFAKEAVSLALDHGFGPLNLHRVEADTDPRNARSVALLERLGFLREGHLRERWIVGDEVSDTALFGLLARDWRATRPRSPA